MDGTGRLFGPLLGALPDWLPARVVSYPLDEALGYAELLPLVEAAAGESAAALAAFCDRVVASNRPPQ